MDPDDTPTLYGTPGLIDMPSARTFRDADLVFTFGKFDGQLKNSMSFQVTPRLTGTFRYSQLDRLFLPQGDTLYDRSFDISYQILAESGMRPALAIGLRDFLGTGVLGGEYVVATKSFGDDIHVTAGIGWGRLGTYNSLGAPFGDRPRLDFGLGGTLTEDQWFRGDAALFGGIEWRATDKLTVTAEYSSDDYVVEQQQGVIDRKSPVNLGLTYAYDESVKLSGYVLHGSEIGASVSVILNPRISNAPTGGEPGPLPVKPRPSRSADPEAYALDWTTDVEGAGNLREAVAGVLQKDGIVLEAMALDARTARLAIRNARYGAHPQAIGRTARVLSRALPASIETFRITLVQTPNTPSATVTLARSDVEALEFQPAEAIYARARVYDPLTAPDRPQIAKAQSLRWALEPAIDLSLFDPDSPVRAELGARLRAEKDLGNGFVVSGSVRKAIVGNLDETDEAGESGLPRVRSDISRYRSEGDPSLERLMLTHYGRPATNLYSRVSAGYLEPMFGGVSGEVLWKPVESRLALGAELSYAKQRDFDQRFGFQDYDVVTGFLSAYYEFDGGFLAQLDVGRYLAGDVGATLSLAREFDNGFIVGAYATRTDATFEDFGEGSFDKGIRLSVPTEWFLGQPSRQKRDLRLRSLSRDGGARLATESIYEPVRETHGAELGDRWERFWR